MKLGWFVLVLCGLFTCCVRPTAVRPVVARRSPELVGFSDRVELAVALGSDRVDVEAFAGWLYRAVGAAGARIGQTSTCG